MSTPVNFECVGGKRFSASTTTGSAGRNGAAVCDQEKKKTSCRSVLSINYNSRFYTDLALQCKWLPPAKRSPAGTYNGDVSPAAPRLVVSMKLVSAKHIIHAR